MLFGGERAAAGRKGERRRPTWPCARARAQVVTLVALGTLSGIDFAGTSPVMRWRRHRLRVETALPKPIITVRGEQQPGARVVRSAIGISIEMARPEGVLANTTIYYTLSSGGEDLMPSCGIARVPGVSPLPRAGEKYETPIRFCGEDSAVTIRAILCPQPGKISTAKTLKSQYKVLS